MKFLLWWVLWTEGLTVIVRSAFLAVADYPRTTKTARVTDVLGLLLAIAIATVAGFLLFGGE